ncbi:MaoC family dehydratase N-terminal domain-containing protein [Aeromicrobium sp. YIM 150415]|uniref:FAS1-like dehydratase domain-containing protein n=1 Tax=Aeromicrobium sp. YIM 150415 TaxID=2803912 RepID=UPI001962DB28|nr:MaoC family dehydratase N-terminal domain-containing protein [Aeromicrobium sp. YIM 150415]MBM9464054.1 MaoC family dehydratase N-terminal domain-containing protein [Aeromicrobium sp. YIM 150415]
MNLQRPSTIEELRAVLGEVVDWKISYPVSASDIRRWAVAVYYPDRPPPRYRDGEAAPGSRVLVAPEEFNPFAWQVAEQMVPMIDPLPRDPDRWEKAIGLAGPQLRHQLNGGCETSYGAVMRVGDVIRSETRLHDYRRTAGRMGPMLVTVYESVWTNQDREMVRIERTTSIRY